MRIFFILFLSFFALTVMAQKRPDLQPTKAPEATDAIYTQEGNGTIPAGEIRKIKFDKAREFFLAKVAAGCVSSAPPGLLTSSVYKGMIVTVCSNNYKYYVDGDGRSTLIYTPSSGYSAGAGININGLGVISNLGDTNAADDITTSTTALGDVTGTFPTLTVDGLQNRPVSSLAPTTGQVLAWNGTSWVPSSAGSGSEATTVTNTPTIANSGTLPNLTLGVVASSLDSTHIKQGAVSYGDLATAVRDSIRSDTVYRISSTAMFANSALAKYWQLGRVVSTDGFYTAGDGGGANYLIQASGVVNNSDVFAIAGGLFAKVQKNTDNSINILQLGGKGDNVYNNTVAFDKAKLLLKEGGGTISLPKGVFRTSKPVLLLSGQSLEGAGIDFSIIKPLSTYSDTVISGEVHKSIVCSSGVTGDTMTQIAVRGITVDGSDFSGDPNLGQLPMNGIDCKYSKNFRIEDCKVIGIENYGIWVLHSDNIIVRGCTALFSGENFEIAQDATNVVVENCYAEGGDITLNNFVAYGYTKNVTFRGCTAKGYGHGVNISASNTGVSNAKIEGCDIDVKYHIPQSRVAYGITVEGNTYSSTEDIVISNCDVRATGFGCTALKVNTSVDMINIALTNCNLYSELAYGIEMNNGSGSIRNKNITVSNCNVNSKLGIDINNTEDILFSNNTIKATADAYAVRGTGKRVVMTGNMLESCVPFLGDSCILTGNNIRKGIGTNPVIVGNFALVNGNNASGININTGTDGIITNNIFNTYTTGTNTIVTRRSGTNNYQITANQLVMPSYTTATTYPVTAVGQLVFDANGNIGTQAIAGAGALKATNGLSVQTDTTMLGNVIGGTNATLLTDREIPSGGKSLQFTGLGNYRLLSSSLPTNVLANSQFLSYVNNNTKPSKRAIWAFMEGTATSNNGGEPLSSFQTDVSNNCLEIFKQNTSGNVNGGYSLSIDHSVLSNAIVVYKRRNNIGNYNAINSITYGGFRTGANSATGQNPTNYSGLSNWYALEPVSGVNVNGTTSSNTNALSVAMDAFYWDNAANVLPARNLSLINPYSGTEVPNIKMHLESATPTTADARVTISSGVGAPAANRSGLFFKNLNSSSPTSSGSALGITATGEVVVTTVAALPTATTANQVPVSTGAGTTYTATTLQAATANNLKGINVTSATIGLDITGLANNSISTPSNALGFTFPSYNATTGNSELTAIELDNVLRGAGVNTGDYALISASSHTITSQREIIYDANSNAIAVTCDNTMLLGRDIRVTTRRNGTNAVTFTASGGCVFQEDGVTTIGATTYTAAAGEHVTMHRGDYSGACVITIDK